MKWSSWLSLIFSVMPVIVFTAILGGYEFSLAAL